MKKNLLIIGGTILTFFVLVNIAAATSSKIADAILGLPYGDQILLVAQRVDENTAKIDENTSKTQQLEQDLNAAKQQLEEEKAKNATLETKLVQTNESNQIKFDKQQACAKANELSQIPEGIFLRTDGESGGNGCGPSRVGFLSSSTKEVLDYLHGLIKHYQDTGLWIWQHSPEVCKYDTEKAIPILEKRVSDYQNYKTQCGS